MNVLNNFYELRLVAGLYSLEFHNFPKAGVFPSTGHQVCVWISKLKVSLLKGYLYLP